MLVRNDSNIWENAGMNENPERGSFNADSRFTADDAKRNLAEMVALGQAEYKRLCFEEIDSYVRGKTSFKSDMKFPLTKDSRPNQEEQPGRLSRLLGKPFSEIERKSYEFDIPKHELTEPNNSCVPKMIAAYITEMAPECLSICYRADPVSYKVPCQVHSDDDYITETEIVDGWETQLFFKVRAPKQPRVK